MRRFALVLVLAVHVFLLTRLFPVTAAVSAEPVLNVDHALHYYRAVSAGRHYLPEGALWGYDPFHACGYPAGTVTDLDDKAIEVFTGVFGPLIGNGRAFNLFLFLAYALFPLAYFGSARLLGFSTAVALTAAALASAFFHFDAKIANWVLFGGYGFVLASVAAPCLSAVLARYVERPDRRGLALLVLIAPVFYLHVLTAVLLAVLGFVLLIPLFRAGRRAVLAAVLATGAIVAVNLPWIAPLVADWGIIVPTPVGFQEGRPLLGTLARHLGEVRFWGLILPVVAGAAGLVELARTGRHWLAAAWGVGAFAILVVGYEGQRVPFLVAFVEPPRLWVSLPFALAIPAGIGLVASARGILRVRSRSTRLRVGAALFLLVAVGWRGVGLPVATRLLGRAELRTGYPDEARLLFERIRGLGDPAGRVAIEEIGDHDGGRTPFGSYLVAVAPLETGRAYVGGPYYRGFTGHAASAFVNGRLAGRPVDELGSADLAAILERYDVTAVVTVKARSTASLRRLTDVLEEVAVVGPYVLFEAKRPSNPFLLGRGTVGYAYDRIEVNAESPGDLVIKVHWDRRLTVGAPRRILREPVEGDPVGFIRVTGGGPGRFVIRNGDRGR